MEQLIVVGAGASGLFAGAIAASMKVNTLILEHTDNIGKKLLSTGNGKCNMTNFALDKNMYYCQDNSFIDSVISSYGYRELIQTFKELGLITRERDGYVYPYSEQAAAVRNILENSCKLYGARIKCNCNILGISKIDDCFEVSTSIGIYQAKKVLIATGGKTFAKSGSDGSGYKLVKALGHKVTKTVPALSSLICHEKYYKHISGVRVKCSIMLFDKDKLISRDEGELQLTDYGISGIPVFNISRQAAYILKEGRKPYVIIDFMKEYNIHELKNLIVYYKMQFKERGILEQMSFLINKKLAEMLIKLSGIRTDKCMGGLTDEEIDILVVNIKHYKSFIANIKGYDFAQVTAGGVDVSEINPATMESKICRNLYFAGEIIDVDGRCGGYNLHFAWASAYIAAMAISDKI